MPTPAPLSKHMTDVEHLRPWHRWCHTIAQSNYGIQAAQHDVRVLEGGVYFRVKGSLSIFFKFSFPSSHLIDWLFELGDGLGGFYDRPEVAFLTCGIFALDLFSKRTGTGCVQSAVAT